MTWEEWKKWSKQAVEDPSWSYCNSSDCGACLGDDLKYQRELLKAFADELVKRMEDVVEIMLLEEQRPRRAVAFIDVECTINELLTEAGIER